MSILIKGALLDGAVTDVYIEKKEIRQVGTDLQVQADQVIDGRRKALIPGFVNAHTHAAMTLFRGFGDDMPLMPWLEQKIWPNEAKLTREDVYWGTKLACLEMIKSGTTTFFDMYHKFRYGRCCRRNGAACIACRRLFRSFQTRIGRKEQA